MDTDTNQDLLIALGRTIGMSTEELEDVCLHAMEKLDEHATRSTGERYRRIAGNHDKKVLFLGASLYAALVDEYENFGLRVREEME